jgi:hypothetical protein
MKVTFANPHTEHVCGILVRIARGDPPAENSTFDRGEHLLNRGLIVRLGYGRYELTERGKVLAAHLISMGL